MRKLIYSLTALLALASCAKEQQEPVPTPPNGGFVTVSFVAEPNSTQTRAFFDASNGNGDKVVPVSTADYYASAAGPVAPRPVHSALDLSRLESVGFHMPDWEEELAEHLKTL